MEFLNKYLNTLGHNIFKQFCNHRFYQKNATIDRNTLKTKHTAIVHVFI